MDAYTQFSDVLAAFGQAVGKDLYLMAEDNTCSFLVDGEYAINLTWLPDAEEVLAWASVGGLPDDGQAAARARRLLEMNDCWRETTGYTLSLSREDRRLVAHDHRSYRALPTADYLAAWVDALVTLVKTIHDEFERDYPYEDDEAEPNLRVVSVED